MHACIQMSSQGPHSEVTGVLAAPQAYQLAASESANTKHTPKKPVKEPSRIEARYTRNRTCRAHLLIIHGEHIPASKM